ncbi:MAG: aminoacyl-tRNA hydrolase [Acidobacteriota bacterium]
MPVAKIVVGLGNPGSEYASSAHNLGFWVVDAIASRHRVEWTPSSCRALTARLSLPGLEVCLAKPQTFMNRSGESVGCLLRELELTPSDMIVVSDDLALPLGRIRVRSRGSSGGHNGLKSIIECLGTEEFARVRLGIEVAGRTAEAAEYVLMPLSASRKESALKMTESAVSAVLVAVTAGLEMAMQRYNAPREEIQTGEEESP